MIQLKTKTKSGSTTKLKKETVLKILEKVKEFIVKFKKEEIPGTAFNLDNIRIVLICGYKVPNYMRKYSSDPELRGKDQVGNELDAFFANNQEIKEDNFFILNVNDLKEMYGPVFQIVWESILNEEDKEVLEPLQK